MSDVDLPLVPEKVYGHCPMGCGQTLYLGTGGHVTCSSLLCHNPGAADAILSESETEHVITIGEERFHIWHPLRERVEFEDLADCPIDKYLSSLDGPPVRPGRYRTRHNINGGWGFEPLENR